MKKITAIIALATVSCVSFGQGTVNWANTSGLQNVSTNSTQNYLGQALTGGTTGLVSGSGVAPSGYYYALLGQAWNGSSAKVSSTIGTFLTDGWLFSGLTANNALGAGRIGGASAGVTSAGFALPAGTFNQFVVVGWSAGLGTSWTSFTNNVSNGTLAAGNYVGISMTGGGQSATSPGEAIFNVAGTITSGFTLFSTTPVPEPSTLALAALGGASLLLFRRRK